MLSCFATLALSHVNASDEFLECCVWSSSLMEWREQEAGCRLGAGWVQDGCRMGAGWGG